MRRIESNMIRAEIIEGLPHNDVIYSTATGTDGKIYLGVSNEFSAETFAHIFSYDPETNELRDIVDLRKLFPEGEDLLRPPHSKIHTSMCVGPDGKVYAVTHVTAPPRGEQRHRIWEILDDPRRGYTGSHLVIYDPATDSVTDMGIINPREGCRFLAFNPEREELYFETYPRAHFKVVCAKTGRTKDIGRTSQFDALGPCWSACGYAFTTDNEGFMLRYDPEAERIERLPVRIPTAPWRPLEGNRVRRMKVGPDGVKLYGVGWSAVRLFEYDPTEGEYGTMRDLGTGWGEDRFNDYSRIPAVKAITFGRDGRMYLAVGEARLNIDDDPGSHIVAKDLETGGIEDFGVIQVEELPPVRFCQDATTGLDGTMYFGTAFNSRLEQVPLQLILFNPEGVKPAPPGERTVPPARTAVQEEAEPDVNLLPQQDAEKTVFVNEGTLIVRELGWFGRSPIIPEGECRITALVRAQNGRIYGATSGARSHFFLYNPAADTFDATSKVTDLGIIGETEQSCRALVVAADGTVYGGTMSEGKEDYEGGHLFRSNSARGGGMTGNFTLPGPPAEGQIEDMGIPIPGQGIYTMTIDPDRNRIYGLTTPGGFFFIHDLDAGTMDVRQSPTAKHISRALICDQAGDVYGSRQLGYLFKYDRVGDKLVPLGVQIPAGRGRDYLNRIDALVRGDDGTIYGGTSDGFLFSFDPETERAVNLGKPTRHERIRAMTVGNDGLIWGVAGEEDGLAHLFYYDPSTGGSADLGVPRANMPKVWAGYEFDAMVTGPSGEIFMGESDRISHLFIYCPPIRASTPIAEVGDSV